MFAGKFETENKAGEDGNEKKFRGMCGSGNFILGNNAGNLCRGNSRRPGKSLSFIGSADGRGFRKSSI